MKYVKHVGIMGSWWFHGVMKIILLLGNGLEEKSFNDLMLSISFLLTVFGYFKKKLRHADSG